jgi:formate dehydrogenase major subunit
LVEEPVAIAELKQFVGDTVLNAPKPAESDPLSIVDCQLSIAVIGGGPAGLSAAYYLRLKGYAVTVYEAMPALGGMLRYGIPEYRLPKSVLQREIDLIGGIGVEFKTDTKVSLDDVREKHDAVIIAIGAWTSTELRCPGEELNGVVGGIDFLREPFGLSGKSVAVVGGGNTAMDACRTAVRMGASKVYCVYRRTRDEMPAQAIEISEAMEEGVEFKFLTNPKEIAGRETLGGAVVDSVVLTVMKLGEPDASGRRAPVPTDKTETLNVDYVIAAIGQKPKLDGFEAVAKTNWGTLIADEQSFCTNLPNVFAIGDATNNGADIAVAAIGEAGRCAKAVDLFLKGEALRRISEGVVKDSKTAADFADTAEYPRKPRAHVKHRAASERARDFREVYTLFGEADAKREAARCLECGCKAYRSQGGRALPDSAEAQPHSGVAPEVKDCRLIYYANKYGALGYERYAGFTNKLAVAKSDHPELRRNPDKCILCGLCVRVCEEVEGLTALGFCGRGFDTSVRPALDKHLKDTACNSCGKCAEVCPTGAFVNVQCTIDN